MYQEANEGLDKTIEKAHSVLVNNPMYIHPLDIESLLKEIYYEYESTELDTSYHKQYYPYLRSLIIGVKAMERKKEIDNRRIQKIKEVVKRRKEEKLRGFSVNLN